MLTKRRKSGRFCLTCRRQLIEDRTYPEHPELVVLSVSSAYGINISHTLNVCNSTGHELILNLTGIVYYNLPLAHYVARIIDKDGRVWYHDGMETGTQCRYEGQVVDFNSARLQVYSQDIFACLLIYKQT